MTIDFRRANLDVAAGRLDQVPQNGRPEIILSGRSNVGKSSLINSLTDQKKLARVSQAPGKTRIILYFLVDNQFYLTDLPGYGYALVAQEVKDNFNRLTDAYLNSGRPISLVLHLLDIRHAPTEADRRMMDWLHAHNLPYQIVLTKADKLSRQAMNLRVKEMAKLLDTDPADLVPFSTTAKIGIEELRSIILAALGLE